MVAQAAGLALLAALSPTALLVAAIYLGSARPRLTAAVYLAGAVLMSVVMGVVAVVVLRDIGLNRPAQHSPRDGLRLGLGVLLLAAGIVLELRKRPQPDQADQAAARPGLLSRMVAEPAPRSAFLVGILVFAPGVSFLAALQVIATARASLELTAIALIVVVVINVLLVWLPIVIHAIAPAATTRYLGAFNGWLRAHSRTVLVWVLIVVGAILTANGAYGLAVGR
jgi:Sap, sulfolipid-1-addressing protein